MATPGKERKKGGRTATATEKAAYLIIGLSAAAIPLVISFNGRDSFRLPKELLFRVEILLLVTVTLVGLVLGHLNAASLRWRQAAVVIPISIFVWTAITSATSTNRALSLPALLYAAGACFVFVATFLVARKRELSMLYWILLPGIVNSLLYAGVELGAFPNPLPLTAAFAGHNSATGLLGNANDVGTALLPIVVAATAAVLSSKERRKAYAGIAILVGAAILVSVSVAAIGAMLVALGSLAFVWNWKRALAAFLLIAITLGAVAVVHQPLRYRLVNMARAARASQWDELVSGRLTPFASAIEMFEDHPLTGVGPGTFGWQYYPYKLEVSERAPRLFLRTAASRYNFEETHNDHLEVLSETGAPGYLLYLGTLLFFGAGSLRRTKEAEEEMPDPRARFSRLVQLPLAAGILVVSLAQYPLQLTSALTTIMFIAALAMAWREEGRPIADEEGADA